MSEAFDPYHVWLGIPPAEQPPNRYRLLGIALFEGSTDVIESAADRQTAHLRSFQTGRHGEQTQRLLNEIAAARVCLCDPQRKAAYDAQLRTQLQGTDKAPADSGVFDKYILLEQLDAGLSGQVAKAKHRTMERIVALKILSREAMASTQFRERFQRKIKMLAQLDHPNVVRAYEAGECQGAFYLAMEYIEGEDLGSLRKRTGPLPLDKAVDYISQAAVGLAYIHSQGAYHRNVKPSNLMLDNRGVIKVVGLGLAHVESGSALAEAGMEKMTVQGQVLGTYDYMSPEQSVDSSCVDPRCDIYSLGCTLYALLTGRPPYPGKGLEQVMAHCNSPIPSLRARRPDVSEALDAVYQKMLAKEPEQRQQSMEEVHADLHWALSPEPAAPAAAPLASAEGISPVAVAVSAENAQDAGADWLPANVGAQSPLAQRRGSSAAGRSKSASLSRQNKLILITAANVVLGAVILAVIFVKKPWSEPQAPDRSNDAAALSAVSGLVIPWPLADRNGATLSIDGKELPVAATGPVEYRLEAGTHEVLISRPGFKPQRQSIAITASEKTTLLPEWEPDTAVAKSGDATEASHPQGKPVEPAPPAAPTKAPAESLAPQMASLTPPAKPMTTSQPTEKQPAPAEPALPPLPKPATAAEATSPGGSGKQLVPDDAARQRAERLVQETYKEDIHKARWAADKEALAEKLLRASAELSNDPAGQYALLCLARDLAAAAGKIDKAYAVIDTLAEKYRLDPLELKVDALRTAGKAAKVAKEHLQIAQAAAAQANEAMEANRFEIAIRFGKLVLAEAGKTSDKELTAHTRLLIRDAERAQEILVQAEKAAETLREAPENSEANLAVGRAECFIKGNWTKGLPLLAKSGNPVIQKLAAQELAGVSEAEARVTLADGWWDLGERERFTGVARTRLQQHAAHWYRRALPEVTGLLKSKIEKRIESVKPF